MGIGLWRAAPAALCLFPFAACAAERSVGSMPAIKLYLPYGTFHSDSSSLSDAQKHPWSHVTFHWFYVGREAPLAPYESLIMGYRGLSAEGKTRAERLVDEFFSEDEFHQLRAYLQTRHRDDLRTTVLTAPVHPLKADTTTRAGSLRPFQHACVEDDIAGSGFCRLCEEDGYCLPFEVWGYYAAAVAQAHLPTPALAAR